MSRRRALLRLALQITIGASLGWWIGYLLP